MVNAANSIAAMLAPSNAEASDSILASNSLQANVDVAAPQTLVSNQNLPIEPIGIANAFEQLLVVAEKQIAQGKTNPLAKPIEMLQARAENIEVTQNEIIIPSPDDQWLQTTGEEVIAAPLPEIKIVDNSQIAEVAIFVKHQQSYGDDMMILPTINEGQSYGDDGITLPITNEGQPYGDDGIALPVIPATSPLAATINDDGKITITHIASPPPKTGGEKLASDDAKLIFNDIKPEKSDIKDLPRFEDKKPNSLIFNTENNQIKDLITGGKKQSAPQTVTSEAGIDELLATDTQKPASNARGRDFSSYDSNARVYTAPQNLPLTDQIKVLIKQATNESHSEITIKLNPAELGKIDVKIDSHKQSGSIILIHVEKPDTLEMLQRDSRSLQAALADAGIDVQTGGLQFSMSGDGEHQSTNEENSDNQDDMSEGLAPYDGLQDLSTEEEIAEINELLINDEYQLIASDGLDIRV